MPTSLIVVLASLALLAASSSAGVRSSAAQNNSSSPSYRGFTFVEGTCESPADLCAVREAKPWTPDEIGHVRKALDEIAAATHGESILNRVHQRGVVTLRRYATGIGRDSTGRIGRFRGIRASTQRDGPRTIDVYDQFFATGGLRDAFSGKPGYLVAAQMLLHECFHGIDVVSSRSEFPPLVGFLRYASGWKFGATTAGEAKILTDFDTRLKALGDPPEETAAMNLNRLALQMRPIRVPTMESIRNPTEAFAEIGSHLVLDRRARTYLPASVSQYFDDRVFAESARD